MAEIRDSDSESESEFSVHAKEDPSSNHVAAAVQLITHHGEVNTSNALKINHGYQKILIELRTKLETMLLQCKAKYKDNEHKLKVLRDESTQPKKKEGESVKNYAYYLCGAPFFKSKLLQPCPPNPDYTTRKRRFKECFPIDLKVCSHLWTFRDKKDLVEGIRLQIINHIHKHNGYCIGAIRGTAKNEQIGEIRRSNQDLNSKSFDELHELATNLESYNSKPFVIDWSNISYAKLCGRHNEHQCEAMWNNYLRPELNHNEWTEDEEQLLLDVALKYQCQDWVAIAAEMNNRSPYQCFVQFQNKFSEVAQVKVNIRWTKEEDEQLVRMVEQHSLGNTIAWNKVKANMPNRNKFQCYNRYTYTLKPGIKKYRFTPEEDCRIMAYIQVHGADFANIPSDLLPGRTNQQIRGRYQNALKRVKECNIWTVEEDQHLMDFVETNGTGNWSQLANMLATHTRLSCRTRYMTLINFLKNNPQAELKDAPRKHRGSLVTVDQVNWAEKLAKLENGEPIGPDPQDPDQQKPRRIKPSQTDRMLNGYFKYAYKFQYDLDSPAAQCTATDTVRNYTTSRILDARMTDCTMSSTTTSSEIQRLNKLRAFEHIQRQTTPDETSTLLPVNWNTTVGLRGVDLLSKTMDVKLGTPAAAQTAAYSLLRKRFRQCFYWPAMLAQTKIESRPMSPVEEVEVAGNSQSQAKEERPGDGGEPTKVEENVLTPVKQENAVDFLHQMFGDSKDFYHAGAGDDDDEDDESFFGVGVDGCKRKKPDLMILGHVES